MDANIIILTLLFSFVFFGILISAYFFFFAKSRMGSLLGVMFVISSFATFAYAMELSTISATESFRWVIARYFSSSGFVLTSLFFYIAYTEMLIKFRSWKVLSLVLFPSLCLLILAVSPNSPILYYQIGLLSWWEILEIDSLIPPLYILIQAYMSALFAFQFFILFRNFRQQTKLDQINTLIISSGTGVILITHLLQLAGWRFLGLYNLNYFSYFPAALLVLWGYQRFRLADIRPVAYNSIFKQMRESVLVIDRRGFLIDYNPAADKILKISSHMRIGEIFDPRRMALQNFPNYKNINDTQNLEIEIEGVAQQVNSSAILDNRGELYGYLITLQDISCQVEAEKLRAQENERMAIMKERNNVARTLHDSIMQDMNSLIILSNAAQERLQQGKIEQLPHVLDSITESARFAVLEVKKIAQELQINGNEEKGFNLIQSLSERVEFVKIQSDARISLKQPEKIGLQMNTQREVFYILLEALNNAIKHAGAHYIKLKISQSHGRILAEIVDDGVGFIPVELGSSGMGISNMRQRASQIGAEFDIQSEPGAGTRVRVAIDEQKGMA